MKRKQAAPRRRLACRSPPIPTYIRAPILYFGNRPFPRSKSYTAIFVLYHTTFRSPIEFGVLYRCILSSPVSRIFLVSCMLGLV